MRFHELFLRPYNECAVEWFRGDAWLLARLREHGLTMDQLAHRLCRSKSWVSRRLGLFDALVASAQDRVRAGTCRRTPR
jgi:hypothetical protein